MPRSPSPDPRAPERQRRWIRETALFGLFLAAFCVAVALAAFGYLQRKLGLSPLITPEGHVIAGSAAYPLFLVVVWRHIARSAGHWLAALTLAALLTPALVFWLHIPPAYALLLGGGSVLPLSVLYARYHRSDYRRAIVVGVIALSLANAVFVSGIFLGVFPPEAMSGDALGRRRTTQIHALLGVATTVLVLGHSLASYYGRTARGTLRRARVAVPAGLATLLLVGAAVSTSREALNGVLYGPREAGLPGGELEVEMEVASREPGQGVSPDRFVNPATCGNEACHPHIYEQWLVSAHRFSATNRAYKKVVDLLAAEEGPEATVFCASCHNPLVAMMGKVEHEGGVEVLRATRLGITCQYCHIITDAHPEQGNGMVDVRFEGRFLPAFSLGKFVPTRPGTAAPFLAEGLAAHNETYKQPNFRDSELCAGCHRIVTPTELNGGVDYIQEDLYTPWLHSSSADMGIECADCHMQLHVYEDRVHARPDHRLFGTIREMTQLVPPELETPGKLSAFDADAERWAAGELPVSLYEQAYLASIRSGKSLAHRAILSGRRAMGVELTVEGDGPPAPGGAFELVVTSRNQTHAHPLPSGPLSLNELWLEVTVRDAAGAELYSNGGLDARGRVLAGTRRLGATPVDASGRPIERHRIWKAAGLVDERMLDPEGSVEDRFEIAVPSDAEGPLEVSARWRYRRYNADIAEWIFGDEWTRLPVHTMAEGARSVALGALDAPAPAEQPAG